MLSRSGRSLMCLLCLLAATVARGVPATDLKGKKPPPEPPPYVPVPVEPALVESAGQELQKAAASEVPKIRAHAIEGMRDTMGAKASDAILAATKDPQPIVRFAALMAAGDLKLAEAKGRLLEMVEDKNPQTRVGVRYALHRIGVYTYSHDLERTAHDPEPMVRGATAMVLGRMEEPSASKILQVMRLDPSALVRQQAGEALYRLGNEKGLEDVVALASSRHPDDQMIGIAALAARNDQRVREHIRAGLTADYPEVQLVAARSLALLGHDPETAYDLGAHAALLGAKSGDPRQRLLGALALGAIGRTDTQNSLAALLKDSDADVRLAAAVGVLQMANPHP